MLTSGLHRKPVVSFMPRQLYPWKKAPLPALRGFRLSQPCWFFWDVTLRGPVNSCAPEDGGKCSTFVKLLSLCGSFPPRHPRSSERAMIWSLNGTYGISCVVVGFGIGGVEPLGSAARKQRETASLNGRRINH